MKLDHKEAICLVGEDKAQLALVKWRTAAGSTGFIKEPLWRQFRVSGTAKLLFLEFMTVDEEVACSPTWPKNKNAEEFGFTWDDLSDQAFLLKMVAREQFIVALRVLNVLAALNNNKVPILQKLRVPDSAPPLDSSPAAAHLKKPD